MHWFEANSVIIRLLILMETVQVYLVKTCFIFQMTRWAGLDIYKLGKRWKMTKNGTIWLKPVLILRKLKRSKKQGRKLSLSLICSYFTILTHTHTHTNTHRKHESTRLDGAVTCNMWHTFTSFILLRADEVTHLPHPHSHSPSPHLLKLIFTSVFEHL